MPKASTTSTILPEYYDYEEDKYKIVFNISTRLNLSLQIATVILNLLHLIVLLRKDLRSFAIYIFMIGICISDILTNSIDFTYIAGEISWMPILFAGSGEMSCLRDDYSEVNVGAQTLATLLDISKRLSVWLAILMAIMRNLSVLYPTNQRIQSMSKAKGALVILGTCVLFWVVFNTWHFVLYRIFWLPDNANASCKQYYKSSITPRYVLAAPSDLHGTMLDWGFIEIIMKFAATTCYPILTISLLITLRKIKNRRKKSDKKKSEKPDHTTRLILLMTIFFMVSEGFAGVLALFQYNMMYFMEINEEFVYAINAAQYPVSVLRTLNALSHPIVCFLLSSQYRDTVRGIFVGKKKLKKLDVTRSTSKVRSRTTTSTIG
ncbi:hypothetical protein B9Z55_017379 [Caenorhabditis nigoni]|uniref:G-protein coupled receptors family 1 profile domain-containing protein n=1 Tax=Caenorhabditis nigoni TaxID=1611254 RepID=A0A2G5T8W0_9PELO|nr:hypothetical protein B9Z55_017379 [Caenorhabditis nigoni]